MNNQFALLHAFYFFGTLPAFAGADFAYSRPVGYNTVRIGCCLSTGMLWSREKDDGE